MPSKIELQRQAVEELALKIKLETAFALDMRRMFRHMGAEFRSTYATRGDVLNANNYHDDITGLLRKHYRKIAAKFSNNLRDNLKKSSSFVYLETKAREDSIIQRVNDYINSQSSMQADLITATNAKEMSDAVTKVVNDFVAINSYYPSRQEIAEAASKYFTARGINRSETIAVTETQNMSERSKYIEASELNSATIFPRDSEVEVPKQIKQWNALLDDKTRPTHMAADGQIKQIEQPFEVGSARMMVPGDSSLGAGPGEVINCRCSVSYYYPD